MAEQDQIQTLRTFFENINRKTLDASDVFTAGDARINVPGAPGPLNPDQYKQYLQAFIDAFPDLHFEVHDVIAQGNQAAATWSGSGIHQAPLRTLTGDSLPATNKRAVVPGASYMEFRDGMIVRHEVFFDQMTLLSQLGLLAPQGGA